MARREARPDPPDDPADDRRHERHRAHHRQGRVARAARGGRSEAFSFDYGSPLSHTLTTKLSASSKISDLYDILVDMEEKVRMAGVGSNVGFWCGRAVFKTIMDMAQGYLSTANMQTIRIELGAGKITIGGYVITSLSANLPRSGVRRVGAEAQRQNAHGRGHRRAGNDLVLRARQHQRGTTRRCPCTSSPSSRRTTPATRSSRSRSPCPGARRNRCVSAPQWPDPKNAVSGPERAGADNEPG